VQRALELPSLAAPPAPARITLHEDSSGRARVAFLINPERLATTARLELEGLSGAVDALDETSFRASKGALEVPVGPLSARMLALEID
jgi:hypothetical protein